MLYVDDIFINGSCIDDIGSVKSTLDSGISRTNFQLLKQFMGLEIEKYDVRPKVIHKIILHTYY